MTLILAQASRLFGLEVSDRLVTRSAKPFDPVSNKNILFFARDAVVALGYTGLAYIDKTPADQWIAETLIAEQFPRGQRPPSMQFRTGSTFGKQYIGPALQLLADRLTQAFKNDRRSEARTLRFEILGVGWQWHRKGIARPILFGIQKPAGQKDATIWRFERHFGRGFGTAFTPEGLLNPPDRNTMGLRLKAIQLVDEAEQIFAETIRAIAQRPPHIVGPDCMSILIPPPNCRWVRIRYISLSASQLAIQSRSNGTIMQTANCAFSPWIVSPGLIHAPSVLTGRFNFNIGAFNIQLEAPEPIGPGLRGAMGAMERPPER